MVTAYGMSELGPVQYDSGSGSVFLGRDYASQSNASAQVAYEIDIEVRKIIDYCHDYAKRIISDHREELVKIAEALIAVETLTAEEIEGLLNGTHELKDGVLVNLNEEEKVIDINAADPVEEKLIEINESEVASEEETPKQRRIRRKKETDEEGKS